MQWDTHPCGLLGFREPQKPQRSKTAVFLYVPMETCKSFRRLDSA
jgi:hypothetical protein